MGSNRVCPCSGASTEAWHKAGSATKRGRCTRGMVHLAMVGRTGATCERLGGGEREREREIEREREREREREKERERDRKRERVRER